MSGKRTDLLESIRVSIRYLMKLHRYDCIHRYWYPMVYYIAFAIAYCVKTNRLQSDTGVHVYTFEGCPLSSRYRACSPSCDVVDAIAIHDIPKCIFLGGCELKNTNASFTVRQKQKSNLTYLVVILVCPSIHCRPSTVSLKTNGKRYTSI